MGWSTKHELVRYIFHKPQNCVAFFRQLNAIDWGPRHVGIMMIDPSTIYTSLSLYVYIYIYHYIIYNHIYIYILLVISIYSSTYTVTVYTYHNSINVYIPKDSLTDACTYSHVCTHFIVGLHICVHLCVCVYIYTHIYCIGICIKQNKRIHPV